LSIENYLRVTSVLYPFSGLDKVDAGILAHAAERGTKVHKICEAIITGLGEHGTDEETWGYVESFKKWWGEGKPVVEVEKRFFCDEHMITGQVDMIIETKDGLAIVDIKTSAKPSKTWLLQGSAYYYLAKKAGLDIKYVIFLHLNKHGKEARALEIIPDVGFFFSTLSVFLYFFNKKAA
jgi:hypothetical protein